MAINKWFDARRLSHVWTWVGTIMLLFVPVALSAEPSSESSIESAPTVTDVPYRLGGLPESMRPDRIFHGMRLTRHNDDTATLTFFSTEGKKQTSIQLKLKHLHTEHFSTPAGRFRRYHEGYFRRQSLYQVLENPSLTGSLAYPCGGTRSRPFIAFAEDEHIVTKKKGHGGMVTLFWYRAFSDIEKVPPLDSGLKLMERATCAAIPYLPLRK